MPLKRKEYLYDGATWTSGGNFKDKLPETGYLCGLILVAEATPVSGYTLDTEAWRLADLLDKVEVLGNGSTVIKSIDWRHFIYLDYLDQQKIIPHWWRNYATTTQREMILINFGRFLWDTEFGLDLSKWKRVDLSLNNNCSSSTHTGNLSLKVLGLYLEDIANPFPRGYLRTEEFKEWTTVASAWERTPLPVDAPLRGIHLQLIPDLDAYYVSETSMVNVAYDVRFSIQRPSMMLHNGGIFETMMLNHLEQPGTPLTAGFIDKTAEYGFNTGLGYVYGMAGISGSKDDAVSSVIPTIDGDNNNNTQNLEAREADSPVQFMAYGMAPENFLTLHYDRLADPSWVIDPARIGNLDLNIQTRNAASAADGTIRVILDSIYPHPTR